MTIQIALIENGVVVVDINDLYDSEYLDIITLGENSTLLLTLATTERGNVAPPEADYEFRGVADTEDSSRQYFLIAPEEMPGFDEGNTLYYNIWEVYGPDTPTPGRIRLRARGSVSRRVAIVPTVPDAYLPSYLLFNGDRLVFDGQPIIFTAS